MSIGNFEYVGTGPGREALANHSLPVWVVFYEKTKVRPAHYQAYIATGKLIKDRHPCMGGVDNKRVGPDEGFDTAEEACAAAVEKAMGMRDE